MKFIPSATLFMFLFLAGFTGTFAASPDSTGVKTENGRQYIIHKVEPKEGWMSIGRRYNVPMNKIIEANPGVEGLKIGQLINIPVLSTVTIAKPVETVQIESNAEPRPDKFKVDLTHTVTAGETLYSISKKYNVKPDDLRNWNDIDNNALSVGQMLLVGRVYKYNNGRTLAEAAPSHKAETDLQLSAEIKKSKKEQRKEKKEAKNREEEEELTEENNTPEIDNKTEVDKTETVKPPVVIAGKGKAPVSSGLKKAMPKTEKGIASWIDDNDINSSKYYALHRTAPSGTIIKVTNRMNNKSVFVKVVGVLPDTGDNSNLIIKLSKAGAMKLEVIDARFQAELDYTVYE